MAKKKPAEVVLYVRLPADLMRELKRRAEAVDRSVASYVRMLLVLEAEVDP